MRMCAAPKIPARCIFGELAQLLDRFSRFDLSKSKFFRAFPEQRFDVVASLGDAFYDPAFFLCPRAVAVFHRRLVGMFHHADFNHLPTEFTCT